MSNGKVASCRTFLLAALMFSAAGWAQPPEARSQIDPARNRVWHLTHEGLFLQDLSAPPKRIPVAIPGWQWAGAPYGCTPDLALGPKGEAVVTSDVVPTLWRIDPETLAVSEHPLALDADTDMDVGFSGLAYSPEHAAYFAASAMHRSLWRIDPLLGAARKIPLTSPVPKNLRTASCKSL